jgi:hypothetical protein
MLVIEHEPGSVADWGGVIERCVFCRSKTRYWHRASNTPICEACARTYTEEELALKRAGKEVPYKANHWSELK